MTDSNPDRRLEDLLRRALVPKGYRPTKDDDIERLLDTVGSHAISEEKKQRMLRKIRGQEAVFPERSPEIPEPPEQLTEAEEQMRVLCRSRGQPLPPDLAAKVKAMEERASTKPKPDAESSNG